MADWFPCLVLHVCVQGHLYHSTISCQPCVCFCACMHTCICACVCQCVFLDMRAGIRTSALLHLIMGGRLLVSLCARCQVCACAGLLMTSGGPLIYSQGYLRFHGNVAWHPWTKSCLVINGGFFWGELIVPCEIQHTGLWVSCWRLHTEPFHQ